MGKQKRAAGPQPRRQFSFDDRTPVQDFPFDMVDAGEPDANAEGVIALRREAIPLYIEGCTTPPNFELGGYLAGDKHIILGQKGTAIGRTT